LRADHYDVYASDSDDHPGGKKMTWQKPQFEEILLNCEINSYAPAEL
jgi:coenzyme PQQ precursor peptide PqqA